MPKSPNIHEGKYRKHKVQSGQNIKNGPDIGPDIHDQSQPMWFSNVRTLFMSQINGFKCSLHKFFHVQSSELYLSSNMDNQNVSYKCHWWGSIEIELVTYAILKLLPLFLSTISFSLNMFTTSFGSCTQPDAV